MKNKKSLFVKIVLRILIPGLFLFFWFICSLFFNSRTSFSVLEYGDSSAVLKGKVLSKLYQNDKVVGEFIARENYLGMVLIRFNDFVVPDYRGEDVLSFKLREKGEKNWYYFNNYRSGSLKKQLLYPFGFPAINGSKGRHYEFELESLYGNSTNAVEISRNKPIIKTIYQFPRKEIAGSKLRLLKFLPVKIANSFINVDFLLSSVIYLIPLFLYFFTLLFFMKNSILRTKVSVYVSVVAILFDILLLRETYIGIFIMITFSYAISVIANKLKANITFIFNFILIIFWILFVSLGENAYSPKLNIWVYALFLIGLLQMLLESKKKK